MSESEASPVSGRRPIPFRVRVQVLKASGGHCHYCGKEFGLLSQDRFTVDHVVPVVAGGKTELANLVAACASCNFRKGSKRDWTLPHSEVPHFDLDDRVTLREAATSLGVGFHTMLQIKNKYELRRVRKQWDRRRNRIDTTHYFRWGDIVEAAKDYGVAR